MLAEALLRVYAGAVVATVGVDTPDQVDGMLLVGLGLACILAAAGMTCSLLAYNLQCKGCEWQENRHRAAYTPLRTANRRCKLTEPDGPMAEIGVAERTCFVGGGHNAWQRGIGCHVGVHFGGGGRFCAPASWLCEHHMP